MIGTFQRNVPKDKAESERRRLELALPLQARAKGARIEIGRCLGLRGKGCSGLSQTMVGLYLVVPGPGGER